MSMKRNPHHRQRKATDDARNMGEIIYWSDRRLQELEALARDFQTRGMTRQEAAVRAYVALRLPQRRESA